MRPPLFPKWRARRHVFVLVTGLIVLTAVASARAELPPTAAVLDHAVAKGQLLTPEDFIRAPVSENQSRSALRVRDASGLEAARDLAAGAVVRSSDLLRPQMVHRGEQVIIILRNQTLQITSTGRALGNAAAGESVRVVSTATNRTLEAVADAPGAVHVPF